MKFFFKCCHFLNERGKKASVEGAQSRAYTSIFVELRSQVINSLLCLLLNLKKLYVRFLVVCKSTFSLIVFHTLHIYVLICRYMSMYKKLANF